jgi:hypothetical protein
LRTTTFFSPWGVNSERNSYNFPKGAAGKFRLFLYVLLLFEEGETMNGFLELLQHLFVWLSQAGNFLGGLIHWQTFWDNVLS